MQIITQNPYKTIGLLADCTEREIQKQKGLIKRFADVGKDISFDTDIEFPTKCHRDPESVSTAFAKIEQAKSRAINGLFWFVKASHYDEPAINYLQDNDSNKAKELWQKLVPQWDQTITARNVSAAHNLSTLKLGLAFSNGIVDKYLFAEGVLLKAKLLNSEFITHVIKRISDETFQVSKEELNILFADELLLNISPFLDSSNGITSSDFMEIFGRAPENLKTYVSKKFVDKPIHAIETLIEETERKRKLNKTNAYEYGGELFLQTKNNLELIKSILGSNDLQYTMLADRIVGELLQCSIEYFNSFRDTVNDPGVKSLQLTRLGSSIACSSKIKERIEENIRFLEEWIADKPERDKYKKIDVEFAFITGMLDEFEDKQETIENAKALVNSCKPKLQNIKNILGISDELYLSLSSRVGADAQSMIVSEVNRMQKFIMEKVAATYSDYEKMVYFDTAKTKFKEAWVALSLIGTLDMNAHFRNRYNENKNSLQSLCNQLGVNTVASADAQNRTSTPNQTNNNEIPTWVYMLAATLVFILLGKACN